MPPTVSIIIPAFNEEKYIGRCLASIAAQEAGQQIRDVIVVDNASTDRTSAAAAAAYRGVRLIAEPRKGLTIAYNRGARAATGDILLFVDADMMLPPTHLKKVLQAFTADPDLVAMSGPYVYKDAGRLRCTLVLLVYLGLALPAELFFNRLLDMGASIASGNCAVRTDAFQRIRGFNESLFYGLEPEFANRLRKIGRVRFGFTLAAESSARRLRQEGVAKIVGRHILTTIWPYIFRRPFAAGQAVDVR